MIEPAIAGLRKRLGLVRREPTQRGHVTLFTLLESGLRAG
jgi:hypothetical protein